jgi:hypothetical protein
MTTLLTFLTFCEMMSDVPWIQSDPTQSKKNKVQVERDCKQLLKQRSWSNWSAKAVA